MYLEWMGKYRLLVEKMIRYANMYAAIYKKEDFYGTDIPISFEQVQVLEYLLENEQLNQNMVMIANRLGITPSNFTRIVNKLVGKGLLEKYYVEGNRKNIVIRVTDLGKEQYQIYSEYIYELSFSRLFKQIEGIPEEELNQIDRKSVVEGKSVDLGGRRIIKKFFFFQAEDGIRDLEV